MTVKLTCEKCGNSRAYLMLDMADPDVDEIPTYTLCTRCRHRGANQTDHDRCIAAGMTPL